MKRNFSVIVAPHDNSRTWNFRLSYRLVYIFIGTVALGLIGALSFLLSYGKILLAAERATLIERENQKLRAQVQQIDSLQVELLNLQALGIQIKGMLGVPLTPDDSVLVASMSPDAKYRASTEDEKVSVGASEQKHLLEAMPSLWPVKGYITRGFHSTGGEKNPNYHPGIDIAAERNTPVLSAADGVVESSRWDETYGWMVEIDHGYGIRTVYGHNTRNLVKAGDRVTRGKAIATVGSTGHSTAPHVHFEIRRDGVPVDPMQYLLN
jgi:murein DD-endopeptidase MepM/ murein hydrolase activator NlpD